MPAALAVYWMPRPRGVGMVCHPPFQALSTGFRVPLASRHLADGEFGWGGISVTRQRRCPKASSV